LPQTGGVTASSQLAENIESASSARRYRDEQGRQFILFENGYTYEGVPGQADFRIIQYAQKGIYLPETEVSAQPGRKQSIPTMDLLASDRMDYTAELHWRLSLPIACFLLAILALPLSYTTPRKGRYSKLALAILIYLVYSNLLGVGQSWVEKQTVPQWLGIWWVHGVAVLVIVYWWGKRAGGIKQLFRQFQAVKSV
jgi:lipopolysaccharide export system permease protein